MTPWLQASRPLAQVNIAVPLAVGELLAFSQTSTVNWWLIALVHAVGVTDHLYIVFANDLADESGDRLNTTHNAFSGGSRVLVDGKLTRTHLVAAARAMAAATMLLLSFGAVWFGRPLFVLIGVAAIALLWAYSYPPARLSYRGLGEAAQGLGVGGLLPLLGYYAQAGSLHAFPWLALVPLIVLGFASNIATALPDREADDLVNKRTWPVRFGLRAAGKHSLLLIGLAIAMTPWVVPDSGKLTWFAVQTLPTLAVFANGIALRSSGLANARACTRFIILNGAASNLLMLGWIIALARPT